MEGNPWLTAQAAVDVEAAAVEAEPEVLRPWGWRGRVSPDVPEAPGLEPGPVAWDGGCRRWLVGAHGGAGVTSLAEVLGWGDGQRSWPRPPAGQTVVVWVVARTNVVGMRAAQRAAMQWAKGGAPGVELGGVVWVADCPKKLPKPLRELKSHVSGGFPSSVTVPWVDAWRQGEVSASATPRSVRQALKALVAQREEGQ